MSTVRRNPNLSAKPSCLPTERQARSRTFGRMNCTGFGFPSKVMMEDGQSPHPRSNNMTPHIPEEFSTRLIDWNPFVIMGNTMPPRDPAEVEEDAETDHADEPPVVR